MGSNREKVFVGIFVLVAVALLFGAVFALSGGIGVKRVPLHAYFKFSGGLDAGGVVRYGGLNVGKITRVRVDPVDSTRIEVEFAVDSSIPVKTDSLARVSSLGLLSDTFLEIAPGKKTSPLAQAGAELPSKDSIGFDELGDAVGSLLPDAQKTLKTLNADLDGLQTTVNEANDLLNERNRANVAGSLNTLNFALAELRPELNKTLKDVDVMLVDAKPKVAAGLSDIQTLTRTLNKRLNPLLDDLSKTLKTTNDTIAHLDGVVGENRGDIKASVESLRKILEQSQVLVGQLNDTLGANSDNLDESLDNIRMTTENLRQLTDTLKTSPSSIIRGTGIKDRKPGGSQK